jgi:hypothetical protein
MRLKVTGKLFQRTIYITFMPDEEIGGYQGKKIIQYLFYLYDIDY